jgi:DNA-binding MarR family transcriptional regulator
MPRLRPDRPDTGLGNLGFLLARAGQRWNALLRTRFRAAGYPDVRASFGAVLVPLFEEDGLRLGALARRSGLAKQTLTTLARRVERGGLVRMGPDPADARAVQVTLTPRGRAFRRVARRVMRELETLVAERLGRAATSTLRAALQAMLRL